LPERGRIGIYNRSYYEEVLVVRAHPDIIGSQQIPAHLVTDDIWAERYEDINNFERHMHRNGTVIVKFFLNVSAEEQRRRFLDRLYEPDKNWKFSSNDLKDRAAWGAYDTAISGMLSATSTSTAPWYVIPADNKWVMRALVGHIVSARLEGLNLRRPQLDAESEELLDAARRQLEAEAPAPA